MLRLFLISFAVLFFEVLLIRWIASEIRIFGFFKNLILIAAVVGMGIGCALGGQSSGQSDSKKGSALDDAVFPLLLLVISAILAFSAQMGLTNISFLFDPNIFVWDAIVLEATAFIRNVVAILSIFFLVVVIFDMLGQKLGIELSGREPLKAYSINLGGSLAGVLVYTLMSYLGTSPGIWLIVGCLSLLPFFRKPAHLAMFAGSIGFAFMVTAGSIWSPYYRIDLKPFEIATGSGPVEMGIHVDVNHDYHQKTLNFRKDFLDQHPALLESNEFQIYYNTYNFPYEIAPRCKSVLILGAGTGNDVAAALRHGAQSVDAVEIDPAILNLGKKIHPEKPYDNQAVHVHNNDARAFLANDDGKYDVIVFGHVDSHTTFSTMASVRLDNYLYTKESLESATRHLSDRGIAALSFAAGTDWLRSRLYQVVKAVSPVEPVAIKTQFDNAGSITILWGPGLDSIRRTIAERRAESVIDPVELSQAVEMPTDDWPFLYQKDRDIPMVYLVMLIVVFILSSIIVVARMRLDLGWLVEYSQFFLLGAGFLLMETRAMLAISILFGSTWLVNSIVIAFVLIMALLANWAVMKAKAIKEWHGYLGLLVTLTVMYLVPLGQFSGAAVPVKLLVGLLILGLPFAFSGIVFSRALSRVDKPERALGINILGALLGGCLEYLSTVVGSNGLTILAIAVYVASWLVAMAVLKVRGTSGGAAS